MASVTADQPDFVTSITGGNTNWRTISIDGSSFVSGERMDVEALRDMERTIEILKNEIAEMILLSDRSEAVSPYSMSTEEYMELPGRVRL